MNLVFIRWVQVWANTLFTFLKVQIHIIFLEGHFSNGIASTWSEWSLNKTQRASVEFILIEKIDLCSLSFLKVHFGKLYKNSKNYRAGKVSKTIYFLGQRSKLWVGGVKSLKLKVKFLIYMFILHFGPFKALYFSIIFEEEKMKVTNVSRWVGGSLIKDFVLKKEDFLTFCSKRLNLNSFQAY